MQASKTLAKGMLIILLATAVVKVFGYGFKIVASRWLGIEGFGLFSLALALFTLIAGLVFTGINLSIDRYVAFYRGKNKFASVKSTITSGLLLIFSLAIFAGIIVFFGANQIGSLMGHTNLAPLLKVFAVMFPFFAIVLTIEKILEGFQRMDLSVFSNLILNCSKFLLLLVAIFLGVKVFGVAISFLIASIFTAFIMLLILRCKILNKFFKKEKGNNLKSSIKEIFFHSIPLTITSMVHTLLTWGDTVILGFFRSVAEVGVYSLVLPTAQLLALPVVASNAVLVPLISNLFAKRKNNEIKSVYKTATKWIFLMMIPLLVLILLFPQRIINTIAGSDFVAGYTTLIILAIGVFIGSLATPANMILLSVNKTKLMMKNSIIAAVVNIVLNIFLIPKYGLIGAAVAFLVSYSLLFIFRIYEVKTIFKAQPFSVKMVGIIVLGIITALLVQSIDFLISPFINFDAFMLLINIASIGILYPSLLYFFKCFDSEDKEILQAIKRRVLLKK
tara:strand:+ start:19796 stop:21307 length:1512 start_codon:yes stop_codon:yes gene_type:complete